MIQRVCGPVPTMILTQQGLGRIVHLDLIGGSAVIIRDYDTIVHKHKLVLELTQGGFSTNRPPWWLALYGYLQKTAKLAKLSGMLLP